VKTPTKRVSHVEEDRPLARRIGSRLLAARKRARMTQSQLAEGRYTKAYVSALEHGLVKPSMAALSFFAGRLAVPLDRLLADEDRTWTRLDADLHLAAGDWQAAIDAFNGLLDADPDERSRPELLAGLAEGLARLERGEDAVRIAAQAGAMFRAQHRDPEAARVRYWEAYGLHVMEQGDQAAVLLHQILDDIAGGLSVEPDLEVRSLIALAMIASRDDAPERALGFLERARARIDGLDDRKYAVFLFSLALSYRELGDLEAAISTGTQSLVRFRAAEAEFEAASVENELALVFLALGNLDTARTHLSNAHAFFERRHDERWLSHVTDTAAQIALAAGSNEEGAALSAEAERLAESSGNRKAAIDAAVTHARSHRSRGDLAGAAATLERAAAHAESIGRRSQLQAVLTEWSDVVAAQGDLAKAYELSRRALDAGRR
jgi:HTH-type transcriptional regulator, quorum sensing regulator NprR